MSSPRFTRRHPGREALDIALLPLSVFMSKRSRSRRLSALRVIVGVILVLVWRVLDAGGHFTMPDVWVLLVVAATLPLSDLFALVPVREGLAALVAIFGGAVAKRTRTTMVEETEELPAPRVPEVAE